MNCLSEIKGRSVTLEVTGRPLIMGVVNITPDSFSDGGRFFDASDAFAHSLALIEQGADILDVGGESTRPGAAAVDEAEELRRTLPLIERLVRETAVPISVDTSKASVAGAALEAGAEFVNDITALRGDAKMAQVVSRSGAGLILMHMQGSPQTMQLAPHYASVVDDVVEALRAHVSHAESSGISGDKLIIDPGIGFGKTAAHNLSLIKHIAEFQALGYPVLLGASRKSFIGHVLGAESGDRLAGSLAVAAWACRSGVQVLRVHDVNETRHVLDLLRAIEAAE